MKVNCPAGITQEQFDEAIAWMVTVVETVLVDINYFKITGAFDDEFCFHFVQK